MVTRQWLRWTVGCLLFCLCTGLVQAQVVKKSQGGLDDLVMASPRLGVHQVVVPAGDIRSEAAAMEAPGMEAVAADWDRFVTDHGSQWDLMLDRRTGRPALASGSGVPWVPGEGNLLTKDDVREILGAGGEVTRGTLVRLAKRFVRQYPELIGVDLADLELAEGATGDFSDYLWYVQFNRMFHGIPVERSYVIFRVNHGNLVQFGGEFTGPIQLDAVPTISMETARQILAGYLGAMTPGDQWLDEGRLSVLPLAPQGDSGAYNALPGAGVEYRLVYTLTFRREGVLGTWEAKIDAHTGEILSFSDTNAYGNVSGGIYPVSPLSAAVVRPFPQVTVSNGTTKYTDAGGNYTFATGTASGALTGKYVKVVDTCGTSSLSTSTSPGNLAFSTSTGTDCTTPGVGGAGNTNAARSGYYALTNWKLKAMAWLPSNTWLQGQLTDNVNLNQTCNAYWNGSSINMFKSGGGCRNSGELPTVVLHEVGHGLDTNDGNSSSDNGTGESYGDTMGFLMTHDSCMGTGFFSDGSKCSGYGDACTTCTGIRDVDYAKHTSATAHTPLNFVKVNCPTSTSYKGPCGREGHCEGYIAAEAAWDLAVRDLPAAGFDANTSWFILERLFYLSRATAGSAYTCNSSTFASDGCGTSSWFNTFRVVDDQDGNLTNGTPHAAAIYAAFNRHGIGCSTAVNTNSTTCATLAQPVLTATAGTGQVALTWPAVTNATKYVVLRNEISSSAGYGIISQPTTNSYTDTAVASGITYYYSVQAVGSTAACISVLATYKSATPAAGTTYSISGAVSGATLSGVTVTTTGASATTDTSGNYTLSGLANGTYTVTPAKSGYTFAPVNLSVTISGASQTGKNFVATAVAGTYSISGAVSGATLSGVTVSTTGASTTTDASGNYTLSGLANGTYTVTPAKAGYTFSPTSLSVTVSGANQTGKNFVAAATGGDTVLTSGVGVSGSVALNAYGYFAVAVPSGATNLAVTLTGLSADIDLYVNNSATHPTTTTYYGRSWNSGTTSETLSYATPTVGTWSIGAFGYAAGSYTVTATVTAGGGTTYSISGTVSGATLSGVTVNLTGAATASTTTDTSGNYTFAGRANGTYTVTPSKIGYTFSPTSLAVVVSGANATGKNFTATASGGTTQLLVNPGFESGNSTWVVSTSPTAHTVITTVTTPAAPHAGSYQSTLGAYNGTYYQSQTDSIRQTVTIPSAATAATLSFWYNIRTTETTTSTAYDKLTVTVENTAGTVLATLTTLSNLNKTTAWTSKTGLSLLSYKGQTVVIRFKVVTDSSLGSVFLVDDAALNVTQ